MIDHVLGRPSAKSRRLQVLAVLAFWSAYLVHGNKNGPPGTRRLSRFLSHKLTAWQIVVLTMTYLYAARNFSSLVGLASPDPLANMYDATFFRATWMMTALDAGFWTAMRIRSRWARDLAGIVFTAFYLISADKADEKVRKVRANLTVEHLRVSWNKGRTPYLGFFQSLLRPRLTRWPPRRVRIRRPKQDGAGEPGEPVMAWLYYDGSLEQLRQSRISRVVLDVPGGGWVSMDPRCNDDRLLAWAVQTGLPVLSLDYHKAPEFPFPYALHECYDTYATLVATRGRCIGLDGSDPVRIVVSGDSAGGNLVTAMTLMIAETQRAAGSEEAAEDGGAGCGGSPKRLPMPEGLVLCYPAMDLNIGNWMSDEQMALIKDRRMRATNRNVIRRKSVQYSDLVGTPHESGGEEEEEGEGEGGKEAGRGAENGGESSGGESDDVSKLASSQANASFARSRPTTPTGPAPAAPAALASAAPPHQVHGHGHIEPVQTRLATSSTISYFNDRVLTPEMMRAMIILYVGPHIRPDFSRNYLLSPVLAPDLLLAHFPKTYFLTGERDPLVDDTVIFASRLRRVKAAFYASGGRRLAYRDADAHAEGFDEHDVCEVVLIPGVSHGFMQFPTLYPPAYKWIERSAHWIEDAFQQKEAAERTEKAERAKRREKADRSGKAPCSMGRAESSGEEDGPLEMMRMTRVSKAKRQASGSGKPASPNEAAVGAGKPGGESSASSSPSPAASAPSVTSTTPTTPDVPATPATPAGGSEAKTAKKKRPMSRPWDDKDLIKLASSDDLLGRRMKGIAGGLSGLTEE